MHRKEMSRKIKNLRSNNSKEYWNILQGTNKKKTKTKTKTTKYIDGFTF